MGMKMVIQRHAEMSVTDKHLCEAFFEVQLFQLFPYNFVLVTQCPSYISVLAVMRSGICLLD
jgi:hypothetical protein